MAITTRDGLISALGGNDSALLIDKASIANASAGNYFSLWRATGQPGQGAIPTTAARCTNALTGALPFTQQTDPATSYLAGLEGLCSNAGTTLEIHDRLMHMGGLNGTLTTAQTVGLDLHANIASDNLAARLGDASYREVSWWMEWYGDTGATASNATINVTFNDATSANLSVVAVGGTVRSSRAILLNGLIQAADAGKFIRDINDVTLSASTATAGNFGFTCTRKLGAIYLPLANAQFEKDVAQLRMERVHNSACLSLIQLASTTSTGTVRGGGKIIHG